MTSSVRYKYVKNTTATPLTVDNFVSSCLINSDGDDKQCKFVKRIITAADIGTNPGQIGEAYGAILDLIPITSNVLWFEANVFRAGTVIQQGMTLYNNIVSDIDPLAIPATPANITQTTLNFGVGIDNSLRMHDKSQGTASAIAAGDIVTAIIILGTTQFSSDVMNP
ncbi:MAG TPA: hypothetical protein PLF17_06080 [Chitinophagaceae bacterium]|nr:hypothetical protein [Chitinophagaceae bacterium]